LIGRVQARPATYLPARRILRSRRALGGAVRWAADRVNQMQSNEGWSRTAALVGSFLRLLTDRAYHAIGLRTGYHHGNDRKVAAAMKQQVRILDAESLFEKCARTRIYGRADEPANPVWNGLDVCPRLLLPVCASRAFLAADAVAIEPVSASQIP